MAGVRCMKLNALNEDVANSLVIGIIIAKSTARIFKSKRAPDEARGVWSFTLRDSPKDTVNCCAWGSPHFVTTLDAAYHVGDVVDVITPRVKSRQLDDRSEQYMPQVSSPFQLILNERQSDLAIHEAENYTEYLPLLHIPTKPAVGYFALSDILTNSQDIKEDSVDLLVAVRQIFPTRMVKTKLGEEIPHRELTVMDQSTVSPLKIMLWDLESIKRSSSWQARETIIFMSDVKLEWNSFNKCIVGRVSGRTVITEDPHTQEAEALRVHARHIPLQRAAILDQLSHDIPDPNSIRSVMTVQQVLDRAAEEEYGRFTALMYAVITQIDLDGPQSITIAKCGGCSNLLKKPKFECDNMDCSVAMGSQLLEKEINLDIRVTLTDHTGSLSNCRLSGKFAENVLNCTVVELLNMDSDMRGQLKWKFLMERCAVRLIVMKGPLISILSCSLGDPNEVVSKLPVY